MDEPENKRPRKSGGRRCMIYGCGNEAKDGYFMHKMPGKMPSEGKPFSLIQKSWIAFIGKKRKFDAKDARAYARIIVCSGHFLPENYTSTSLLMYQSGLRSNPPDLKDDAVPTVFKAEHPFTSNTPTSVPSLISSATTSSMSSTMSTATSSASSATTSSTSSKAPSSSSSATTSSTSSIKATSLTSSATTSSTSSTATCTSASSSATIFSASSTATTSSTSSATTSSTSSSPPLAISLAASPSTLSTAAVSSSTTPTVSTVTFTSSSSTVTTTTATKKRPISAALENIKGYASRRSHDSNTYIRKKDVANILEGYQKMSVEEARVAEEARFADILDRSKGEQTFKPKIMSRY